MITGRFSQIICCDGTLTGFLKYQTIQFMILQIFDKNGCYTEILKCEICTPI